VCVLCQLAAPGSKFPKWNFDSGDVAPPEDEQAMLKTCRGPLILNKLSVSCWFNCTELPIHLSWPELFLFLSLQKSKESDKEVCKHEK
jgi:hypothetical protein